MIWNLHVTHFSVVIFLQHIFVRLEWYFEHSIRKEFSRLWFLNSLTKSNSFKAITTFQSEFIIAFDNNFCRLSGIVNYMSPYCTSYFKFFFRMLLGFPRAKQGLCHTKHGGAGGIILWALLTVFLVFISSV